MSLRSSNSGKPWAAGAWTKAPDQPRENRTSMNKSEVRDRIQEIGIIPGVRVTTTDDARFAAEAVYRSGIPIAEITMTVPNGIEVIAHLAKTFPDMVVGAGTVLNVE